VVSGDTLRAINIGGEYFGLIESVTGSTINVRTLSGGTYTQYSFAGAGEEIILLRITGLTETAVNIGVGNGIFTSKTGNNIQLRSISGGTNITATVNGSTIVIDNDLIPSGVDGSVQFVTGGQFDSDTNFIFNKTTDILTVPTIDIQSGLTINSVVVSSNVTLSNVDGVVYVNTTSPRTIILPPTPRNNQIHIIKDYTGNSSTNTMTIDGNSKNIDGDTTADINSNYASIMVQYNAQLDTWFIIGGIV